MLPQGEYKGRALGWFRPANLVWRGKVFRGERVTNLILGLELVPGRVRLAEDGETVLIEYRWLVDRLVPNGQGFDGTMRLGWITVRFTLT